MSTLKLVIVGGGIAGTSVMNHLVNFNKELKNIENIKITLIDQKDYFENAMGIPYALTRGEAMHEKVLASYSKAYGHDKRVELLVPYRMVSMNPLDQTVSVQRLGGSGSELVPYDLLVVALGSQYSSMKPSLDESTVEKRKLNIHRMREQLQKAAGGNGICIVGGNATGIELAGELASIYGGNKITLISSGDRLLNRLAPSAGELALKTLRSQGVTVLLDDKVPQEILFESSSSGAIEVSRGNIVTAKGATVSSDIVVPCVGCSLNTEPLDASPAFGSSRDTHGQIYVNEYLQSKEFGNVFSVGDIVATGEEKSAMAAMNQAKSLVQNLARTLPLVSRNQVSLQSVLQTRIGWKPYQKMPETMQMVHGGEKLAFAANEHKVLIKGFIPRNIKPLIIANAAKCMLKPTALLLMKQELKTTAAVRCSL